MNKHVFKAGDKVYCPMLGTRVYTVERNRGKTYPIKVLDDTFTGTGHFFTTYSEDLPSIYPATKDNHRLLSELHGVEFEPPELTGSDRVRQMLKENPNRAILCGVSDQSDQVAKSKPLRIIVRVRDDGKFITDGDGTWLYAIPIDESELKPQELYTGK